MQLVKGPDTFSGLIIKSPFCIYQINNWKFLRYGYFFLINQLCIIKSSIIQFIEIETCPILQILTVKHNPFMCGTNLTNTVTSHIFLEILKQVAKRNLYYKFKLGSAWKLTVPSPSRKRSIGCHSIMYKLCAFPMRHIPIPGEDMHYQ